MLPLPSRPAAATAEQDATEVGGAAGRSSGGGVSSMTFMSIVQFLLVLPGVPASAVIADESEFMFDFWLLRGR